MYWIFARAILSIVIAFLASLPISDQSHAEVVLKRSSGREPGSLDPHLVFGSTASEISSDMFEGLLVLSVDGEPVSGSAKSYTVSEDGLIYTFYLREDLTWSDGKPLGAVDFVSSFRRLVDPQTASPLAGNAFPIKNARAINRSEMPPENLGVTALDEYTVRITLDKPVPYFPKILLSPAFFPVPQYVIDEYGKSWMAADHVVSNGAYKLTGWLPMEAITLVRNEKYYGNDRTKIDKVTYYPVENEAQGFLRYRAGEIDVLRNFPPDSLDWIRENLSDHLLIHPTLQSTLILMNLTRASFNDVRVRKALSISIDREVLTDKVLKDESFPAHNLVNPRLPGYGENAPPYSVQTIGERQAEARNLLSSMGYTAANPLAVHLKYANFERLRPVAIAVQAMWREVGIEAELESVGPQVVTQDMMSGYFDLLLVNDVPRNDDPAAMLEILRLGNPQNYSHYNNQQFENLVLASFEIKDVKKRYELLKQAETMAMIDVPTIPLYFIAQRLLINPRVKGWAPVLRGPNYTRNLWIVD